MERIDDLQLALSSVLAAGTGGDDLAVEFAAEDGEVLRVWVGPLHAGIGEDAGLLRILGPLVDEVMTEERDGGDWLVLAMRAAAA